MTLLVVSQKLLILSLFLKAVEAHLAAAVVAALALVHVQVVLVLAQEAGDESCEMKNFSGNQ
jgi:hypothetical protein